MQQRCDNPKNEKYADYGGRGIAMCERWRSFENFLADMGERPAGTSLDRIDNDRGYEPSNCRWATRKEQVGNQRRSNRVTYRGKEYCLQHLSDQLGINPMTLLHRIKRGWPEDRWSERPAMGRNQWSDKETCREAREYS
jgi:hypothetical protein